MRYLSCSEQTGKQEYQDQNNAISESAQSLAELQGIQAVLEPLKDVVKEANSAFCESHRQADAKE